MSKPDKPGYKTTEFWITVGVGIAGVIFMALGNAEAGAALTAITAAGYSVSRGQAKK